MNTLGTKRMEMFICVQENRQEFILAAPEGSHGAALFEQLGQIIERVRNSAYNQSRHQSAVRESQCSKAAARDELVGKLDTIYQTARVLAFTDPGLEDKFLPPYKVPDQALLTLASTYGNDAFPFKAEFVKRGLSADFIAELSEAAVAFDSVINTRTQGLGRQIVATAEISEMIDLGRRIVRELGVVVRNVYADNPAKLALWRSVSHVERPARRARPKEDGNQPPPAQP